MAEETTAETDPTAAMESSMERALAASSLGPLAQRQEGVAQMIVEEGPGPQIEKLTYFRTFEESRLYARAKYLLDVATAAGQDEFEFPPTENLLRTDYRTRTSVKQQTRKILESITKIFERGGEGGGGRGLWGRRRG